MTSKKKTEKRAAGRTPPFVQIAVSPGYETEVEITADLLYGLDKDGRVWARYGNDDWDLIDNAARV